MCFSETDRISGAGSRQESDALTLYTKKTRYTLASLFLHVSIDQVYFVNISNKPGGYKMDFSLPNSSSLFHMARITSPLASSHSITTCSYDPDSTNASAWYWQSPQPQLASQMDIIQNRVWTEEELDWVSRWVVVEVWAKSSAQKLHRCLWVLQAPYPLQKQSATEHAPGQK